METTPESIIEEMKQRVKDNIPVSAASWCESALRVHSLLGDYDNTLAEFEAEMAEAEAKYLMEGETAAKAKVLSKNAVDYKRYLKLKAFLKWVDEFIKLSKRRASINEF